MKNIIINLLLIMVLYSSLLSKNIEEYKNIPKVCVPLYDDFKFYEEKGRKEKDSDMRLRWRKIQNNYKNKLNSCIFTTINIQKSKQISPEMNKKIFKSYYTPNVYKSAF